MSKTLQRRFIASAVCPSCKQIDKIQLCREQDDERIECINCGYFELKSDLAKNIPEKKVDEQPIVWYFSKTKD